MSSSVSFGRKRIPFLPKILVLKSSNGTHTQKKTEIRRHKHTGSDRNSLQNYINSATNFEETFCVHVLICRDRTCSDKA